MADLPPDLLLQHSKLFALLDEPGRKRLVAVAAEERFPPGHAVVREGEFGDSFFLVLEGELSVRIGGIDATREVALLLSGAFFGEIAALLGESRSATVLCVTDTRVLRFDGPRVQGILKDYPVVREALVKLGLKRSEDNLQQLMEEDFPGVPVTATGEGAPFSTDASRASSGSKDD
ncbi:MAG: cyclic nucleotide-binding domain-containing protein [Deltaproteobacteria bacterium]|nr:cyclic nucleotide-binding domain-containing protein [Deltaproteobacteria bacterium]